MKVKCINTGSNVHITVGKSYKAEALDSDHYEIVNDKGHECSYQKVRFEVVPEIEVVKVTLDLPEIEVYEYTGEYRAPKKGEWLYLRDEIATISDGALG